MQSFAIQSNPTLLTLIFDLDLQQGHEDEPTRVVGLHPGPRRSHPSTTPLAPPRHRRIGHPSPPPLRPARSSQSLPPAGKRHLCHLLRWNGGCAEESRFQRAKDENGSWIVGQEPWGKT